MLSELLAWLQTVVYAASVKTDRDKVRMLEHSVFSKRFSKLFAGVCCLASTHSADKRGVSYLADLPGSVLPISRVISITI